jgi:hypothetical protein
MILCTTTDAKIPLAEHQPRPKFPLTTLLSIDYTKFLIWNTPDTLPKTKMRFQKVCRSVAAAPNSFVITFEAQEWSRIWIFTYWIFCDLQSKSCPMNL